MSGTTNAGAVPTRSEVHARSGHRLGAARPRQEGPVDLRLVPPALAAWGTAAVTLDASPGWGVGVVVVALVAAGVLLAVRGGRRCGRSWISGAAVLVCVAAAAASAGLHGADLRRGPIPALAREFTPVTAEAEITSDPRLTRPRVSGAHMAPPVVLIEAEVRRVERTDGGPAEETRTPVLLIVDVRSGKRGTAGTERSVPDGAGDGAERDVRDGRAGSTQGVVPGGGAGSAQGVVPGGGAGSSPVGRGARQLDARAGWLGLLPSVRVRVEARVVPASAGGGRVAAVLRVKGRGGPEVVGEPSWAQRLAGRLRAGLREATDGLSADARALLPGLVVGDTSRITPELDKAFRETDLTHTLAVSGANFTILLALLLGPPGLAQRAERRGLAPRLGISLRMTAVLGAALSLGFVVVCRPDPSVLRAAACGSVALLALATGRRRSLIPALATAVLLLVLYDPWLARSYGFLLSVLATGALLTIAPRWSVTLRRRGVP
ncbi:ComEC/Rec2 family competence protein, partial [Streptomyces sp. 15-116A]|uniref:ComEC/Rec2 family competence protein n=1 Tax=Streptomyces sp. 15-116A TaxID=2259035 RepID=UPI0021B27EF1